MITLKVKIQRGLILHSPPYAPDQAREHLSRTQRLGPAMRTEWELASLQVRPKRFEIFINGHIELEQRVRTAYLLLHEHESIQATSCFRMTAHTLLAPCSSIFAGNRVMSIPLPRVNQ